MDDVITPQVVDGSRQLAIEIRAQRDLALAKPRNEKDIFEKAIKELELAPEFAEEAFYAIPYKKKDPESGETVEEMVEGLSVKSSRAVARIWGNCATAARIAAESDDAVECEGIFVDFETNAFFRATFRVSKTFIPRGTKIATPLTGTHLTNAIQAGLSKAERNATLKGLPEWFKVRYFGESKKIAGRKGKAEGKTVEERKEALFAAFKKLGVEKDRVAAYIAEKYPNDQGSDEMFGGMRGILNGIKEKRATVEDVFPTKKAEEKPGAVKLSDIPGANL